MDKTRPFEYGKVSLNSLRNAFFERNVPVTGIDFFFYVPRDMLVIEKNPNLLNRQIWVNSGRYSLNSDVAAIFVHENATRQFKGIEWTGAVGAIQIRNVELDGFVMKRKNGVRSRFSSKKEYIGAVLTSLDSVNETPQFSSIEEVVQQVEKSRGKIPLGAAAYGNEYAALEGSETSPKREKKKRARKRKQVVTENIKKEVRIGVWRPFNTLDNTINADFFRKNTLYIEGPRKIFEISYDFGGDHNPPLLRFSEILDPKDLERVIENQVPAPMDEESTITISKVPRSKILISDDRIVVGLNTTRALRYIALPNE